MEQISSWVRETNQTYILKYNQYPKKTKNNICITKRYYGFPQTIRFFHNDLKKKNNNKISENKIGLSKKTFCRSKVSIWQYQYQISKIHDISIPLNQNVRLKIIENWNYMWGWVLYISWMDVTHIKVFEMSEQAVITKLLQLNQI